MSKSELKRRCTQDPLEMMEEIDRLAIDRLARLCEAKDAEIVTGRRLLREQMQLTNARTEEFQKVQQQLSDAQAQIAMQAEALNAVFNATAPGTHYCSPDMQLVKVAITATSETVAAWRAKETEPLRREVAMLRDAVNKYLHPHNLSPMPNRLESYAALMTALNDTHATALAYERGVENRGAVKALEELLTAISGNIIVSVTANNVAHNRGVQWCKDTIDWKISELRASKGEVK